MKRITEESFELSTGKMFSPNCGFIGLALNDNNTFSLSGGYDTEYEYSTTDEPDIVLPDLTTDETKEVALYMIDLWTDFANSLK